jgi:hypothetical protein
MSANANAAVATLQRHFGGQVDPGVLEAVLEMCGGNVNDAKAFLEADGNGPAQSFQELQAAAESGSLPPGYPKQGPRTVADWSSWLANKKLKKASDAAAAAAPAAAVGGSSPAHVARDLLDSDAPLSAFIAAFSADATLLPLVAVLVVSQLNGVELRATSKSKVLAAAWTTRHFDVADFFFAHGAFGFADVLRAAKLLDGRRQIAALEARLAKMRDAPKVKPALLSKLRERINEIAADQPAGTLPSSLKRRVRAWISTVPANELVSLSLGMPTAPWRELADLCHFSARDFQLGWFAKFVFDGELPDGEAKRFTELVASRRAGAERRLDDTALVAQLLEMKIPFAALKQPELGLEQLPLALRAHCATYESLEVLIWNYEALACKETNDAIAARLARHEPLTFATGKLIERAMVLPVHLRPALLAVADAKLATLSLPLASPVVVLGDASNSMDVAIRVSTLLAGMACNLCDASLRFFNDKPIEVKDVPHSAAAIVEMALKTKASGLTACGAGLHEFLVNRTFVKTFVLVSDEIENESFKGQFFPDMFREYLEKVNPDAQLALVSFRDGTNLGRIQSALLAMGIDPVALSLSAIRPDSSRIDALLAKLAQHSSGWSELLERAVYNVRNELNSGRADGSMVELLRREFSRAGPPPVILAASAGDDDDGNSAPPPYEHASK